MFMQEYWKMWQQALHNKTMPNPQQFMQQWLAQWQSILSANDGQPQTENSDFNAAYNKLMALLMQHWQECLQAANVASAQADSSHATAAWRAWLQVCDESYRQLLATTAYQQAYADFINSWLRSRISGDSHEPAAWPLS